MFLQIKKSKAGRYEVKTILCTVERLNIHNFVSLSYNACNKNTKKKCNVSCRWKQNALFELN